jgi:hypothetical protein
MDKNDIDSNSTSTTKKIQFNLNRPMRVTRIFIKDDHKLMMGTQIFTMMDVDNPSMSIFE